MAEQAPTPHQQDAATPATASTVSDAEEVVEDRIETVRLRRVPKYSVFLIAGAALGILVAMLLTFSFNGSGDVSPNTGLIYSSTQVFGFLALICITVGVALGGVLALILDRVLARRSREVAVDRERIRVED